MSSEADFLRFAVTAQRGGFRLAAQGSVADAGITALFGPSGAGKTSLLRVIAGLEDHAEGAVIAGGDVWLDSARRIFVAPHKRRAAVVFQDGRLFAHLDVAGNLAYAERRARRLPQRIARDDVIAVLGLAPLLARAPETLSGGERQRVAIGRALLAQPRILLMDEPLSALDLTRRAGILAYIERLPQIARIPILYVTHAVDEIARIARNVILLRAGTVAAAGAVHEVMARLDVDDVLGRFEAGTLVEGRVTGEDRAYGLTHVAVGAEQISVPALGFAAGEAVRLRIRARDVSLALARPQGVSIRNVLAATVSAIAEDGTAHAEVLMRTQEGQAIRARITRLSVHELGLAPGREVQALIKSIAIDRQLLPQGRA